MRYRGPKRAGGRRRVGEEMKQVAEEEKGWRMEGETDRGRRKGGRQGRAEDTAAMKPVICEISHGTLASKYASKQEKEQCQKVKQGQASKTQHMPLSQISFNTMNPVWVY